jgi:N-hydroxyarylamine O-acetyltransferase
VNPYDVVMGHHYTSTYQSSHFTSTLVVTKHLAGRHVTVTHDSLTIRTPGEPTTHRPLRDGEIEEWLSTLQVGLTPGEQTLLLEKLRTLTG